MTTLTDPYTAAMTAPEQERHYFGLVTTVDSYFCVLQKGTGKRVWDPTRDAASDRRIAIKLSVECAKRDGGAYTVDQDCLNFERAWIGYTLPSLQKLGLSDLRALKGKSCHIKRISTGEHYTNQKGEQKEKSAIVFIELFEDAAACNAASETFYGDRRGKAGVEEADVPEPPKSAMPPEQQFALNSLPALWKASGHNAEAFTKLINDNPMIKRWYPATHPHVRALIAGTIEEAPADDDLPF
jgi:hypothetical protein